MAAIPTTQQQRLRAAGLLLSLGVASVEDLAATIGASVAAVRQAAAVFDNGEPPGGEPGGTPRKAEETEVLTYSLPPSSRYVKVEG